MAEYRVSADAAGQRLDKYVKRVLGDLPTSAIYRLIRTKKIRVNGVRCEEAQLLNFGDVITIRNQAIKAEPPAEKPKATSPMRQDFEVLHEDGHILVCNKPAGLAVHPGTGVVGPTLVDQVRAYLGGVFPEGEFKPAPAHRLDRETSGVVIVAKTRQAIVKLSEVFTEGTAKKVYLALVKGKLEKEGVIDIPLAEHQQSGANKQQRGVNMQQALTRFRLLAQAKEVALVEVEIETGRTHQIRRHFAGIGHPVVGDAKYGDFPFNRKFKAERGLKRMFLHSARLGLAHPVTGQAMVAFRAPLPVELGEALDRLSLELPAKFARAGRSQGE